MKRKTWNIMRNEYGYLAVYQWDHVLWIIPYRITQIEAHHNRDSAREHIKFLQGKPSVWD